MSRILTAAALTLALATPAAAAQQLERVESPPLEAAGSARELVGRGRTCMARVLGSRPVTDLEGGVVVAASRFAYTERLLIPLAWEGRSTVTLEASDGRFRVTHTDIAQRSREGYAWGPVNLWRARDGDRIRAELEAITADLAACVRQRPAPF